MMVFDHPIDPVVTGVYRIHIVKNFLGGEMMKGKKTTRRALVMSLLSLLLCCSMLVGTTFAWFTDSVTSGRNQIIAGNLDVELYYSKDADFSGEKVSVQGKTNLFTDKNGDPITYWEPGVVAYTNLQVANVGNLALKYQLSVNFENKGPVDLSKALQVAVVEGGFEGDRADAQRSARQVF